MNVFSTLENMNTPVVLTEENYNKKTKRTRPYVRNDGQEVRSYAICPACKNPTLLINRLVSKTAAQILYAKHAGYTVPDLAVHNGPAYEQCPFHNPERFDTKKRSGNAQRDNQIREALLNHIHLVITTLENATGIKYNDKVIESMLRDFGGNKGYEYKAISIYNLPFGFAYMTEAQDLWGLKVESAIEREIAEKSIGFETDKFGNVWRKEGSKGTKLIFYFNRHRIGEGSTGSDVVDLMIEEVNHETQKSIEVYKKTIEFDSAYFFNVYMRRERLRLLALKYL